MHLEELAFPLRCADARPGFHASRQLMVPYGAMMGTLGRLNSKDACGYRQLSVFNRHLTGVPTCVGERVHEGGHGAHLLRRWCRHCPAGPPARL